MKTVFLAGSRKFSSDLNRAFDMYSKTSRVLKGRDDIEDGSEEDARKKMFSRIDESDIVYVVANNGYNRRYCQNRNRIFSFQRGKKSLPQTGFQRA